VIHDVSSFNFGNGGSGGGFSFSGILPPDIYEIRGYSSSCSSELQDFSCGFDSGDGTYSFSFKVIPEPSTALSIGFGLFLLSQCFRPRRSVSLTAAT
jgi:hypothetical protein